MGSTFSPSSSAAKTLWNEGFTCTKMLLKSCCINKVALWNQSHESTWGQTGVNLNSGTLDWQIELDTDVLLCFFIAPLFVYNPSKATWTLSGWVWSYGGCAAVSELLVMTLSWLFLAAAFNDIVSMWTLKSAGDTSHACDLISRLSPALYRLIMY